MTDIETTAPAAAPEPAAAAAAERPGLLRSPAAKFFLIAILSLALMAPLLMVYALTTEREIRRDEVISTFARDWAGRQTLYGPLLLVPYTVTRVVEMRDDQPVSTTLESRTAVILPDDFKVDAETPTELRRISIFDVAVYTANVRIAARFGKIGGDLFPGDVHAIDWAHARLSLGLGDLGGVETAPATIGGEALAFEPGIGVGTGNYPTGLNAVIPAALAEGGFNSRLASGLPVTVDLRIKGVEEFAVAPVGRQSEIRLASNWPHPGFAVGALPSEREIRPDGFSAVWRVPYLARNVPQAWVYETDGYDRFSGETVGVDLTTPVDFYSLTERALKYGLMFVGAVFGIVFMLEVLSPRRIHIVQYALVGLILVFFYVLLLAFAEQVGFGPAYAVASVATGLVVSVFVGLQLASRLRAIVAAAGFAVLFALLYVILRLEDVALMAGAITGFLLLTVVLFATRRVDWSGTRPVPQETVSAATATGT